MKMGSMALNYMLHVPVQLGRFGAHDLQERADRSFRW